MPAKPLRTASTPIGTFTRRTDNLYKFVGVWRFRTRYISDAGPEEWHEHEVVKWSRSPQGACTNPYVPASAQFFGPYPVDELDKP